MLLPGRRHYQKKPLCRQISRQFSVNQPALEEMPKQHGCPVSTFFIQ
ncbi:hypothetical protein DK68_2453 [Brucella suis]|nr:hypothetical protein C050_00401 [Brucella suis 92/63]ENR27698.1 hypothetical protein C978_00406 [Brucella suis 94/11]ENR34077.1 hypothetical protein C006_01160 [Brucella suis F5/03-2]ENR36072.1 hypothetical protein C977_01027 [Brucella suis F4/06-146]ENR43344.1 hypothetical protein C063_00380 [Brucella suis F8/06-2]ENT34522.1 hypothetical protein C039_00399 [Brucella suis 63/261]ENT40673.1 hypothetical protein C049_00433 [Brucella suis F12/02]ENT44175.1 hypothetical protein B986_01276 [Br